MLRMAFDIENENVCAVCSAEGPCIAIVGGRWQLCRECTEALRLNLGDIRPDSLWPVVWCEVSVGPARLKYDEVSDKVCIVWQNEREVHNQGLRQDRR